MLDSSTSEATGSALRSAGLRVTRQRLTVLEVLRAHPHSTADMVETLVRKAAVAISTQAVYDVLDALHRAGLVRRIEPAGSPAIFEARVRDNHHHLVCRSCGAIVDVECAVGTAPCLTPSEAAGFVVDEAEVVFWGLCPDCQTKPKHSDEVLVNDTAVIDTASLNHAADVNDAVTDEHREATP